MHGTGQAKDQCPIFPRSTLCGIVQVETQMSQGHSEPNTEPKQLWRVSKQSSPFHPQQCERSCSCLPDLHMEISFTCCQSVFSPSHSSAICTVEPGKNQQQEHWPDATTQSAMQCMSVSYHLRFSAVASLRLRASAKIVVAVSVLGKSTRQLWLACQHTPLIYWRVLACKVSGSCLPP